MDYGFVHEDKTFTPAGTVAIDPSDNDKRNREIEAHEIEQIKHAVEDRLFLYIGKKPMAGHAV